MERDDSKLRELLVKLLQGETHMSFDDAISNYPLSEINIRPTNGQYSVWQLMEHIRFTQRDILNFITDKKYTTPDWPVDYWPGNGKSADEKMWKTTIESYKKDLKELEKIVLNPKIDLYQKIPWGEGQTMIEEFIKVADHTSYHLGELGILRQVMFTWSKDHH
jgi:hypothetical protein